MSGDTTKMFIEFKNATEVEREAALVVFVASVSNRIFWLTVAVYVLAIATCASGVGR